VKDTVVIEQAADPRQWQFFSEFVRYETAVGGPDPHMALTGAMCEGQSWLERAWCGGCYIGVYNVPTAEVLWRHWPHARVMAEPDAVEPWIDEHWKGLAFRRERRAARSSTKLAQFMVSYAHWIEDAQEQPWWGEDYDAAWKAADEVYSVGRYIKLKILEYLRRYCDLPAQLTDMRARGGWSPRTALCLLYPERAEALLGDDSAENCAIAEATAVDASVRLREEFGLELDAYSLQVLLCDYKQSYSGRRQFPGRSQDSEIAYHHKIEPHWRAAEGELVTTMFDVRKRIFPHCALGELNGWREVREELGDVLRDEGYTWTDTLYDYMSSRGALFMPVRRKVTV
jgi:hypothetical protein